MARMLQALKNLEAKGNAARPVPPFAQHQSPLAITEPIRREPAAASPSTPEPLHAAELVEAKTPLSPASQAKASPLQASPALPGEPTTTTQAVSTIDFAAAQIASLTVGVVDSFLPAGFWPNADASNNALHQAVEKALGPQAPTESRQTVVPSITPHAWPEVSLSFPPASTPVEAEPDHIAPGEQSIASGKGRQGPFDVGSAALSMSIAERPAPLSLKSSSAPHDPAHAPERPLTPIERTALKILNDPIRSRPLVDLADRFEADARQTGSHTIVIVHVGSGRGAAEALVLAGTLLAERRQRDLLLLDADWNQRSLTAALQFQAQSGLGDALANGSPVAPLCQPLATRHLKFLAAGHPPEIDLALAEPRLESSLKSLAEAHDLVLIDGGPTGSPLNTALVRQSDATYLLVELGVVEAADAQAALRDLRAAGARVLGCIAT